VPNLRSRTAFAAIVQNEKIAAPEIAGPTPYWLLLGSIIVFSVYHTICKAKPVWSPPGYPPRRLLIIVDWSVY